MKQCEAAQLVAQLTAAWKPGPAANADSLDAARHALAASFQAGKTAADVFPAGKQQTAPTPSATATAAITKVLTAPARAPIAPGMAFVRSLLSTDVQNPTGVPAWARGMKVEEVHGPFTDSSGILHWVHLIPLTTSIAFAFGNPANIFAVFPVQRSFVPQPIGRVQLGAGSVWFLAKMLTDSVPAGNVTGFRIRSGVLELSPLGQFQNNVYVLPANARVTLTANLDAPAPAGGSGSIGADASASDIQLPASTSIVFTQSGATVRSLDNSSAKFYGSSVTLTRNTQAPVSINSDALLLVQCDASAGGFEFVSVKSTLFAPAGKASLDRSGWALPVATTPITSVGEASGAGALLLELGAGANLTCEAHPATSPISSWQFLLSPAQIFAFVASGGPLATVTYPLWPERKPSTRNSTIEFTTAKGALISFLATPGNEILTVLGLGAAHLDRPLAADGSRFRFAGLAVLQINLSNAGKIAGVFAAELPPFEQDVPIALENALIGVRGPLAFAVFGSASRNNFLNATAVIFFSARWLLPTLPDPYAASFDLDLVRGEQQNGIGVLEAVLRWPVQGDVASQFFLLQAAPQGVLANAANTPAPATVALLDARSAEALASTRISLALLDLSTRVDQFGVAMVPSFQREAADATPAGTPAPAFGFEGLSLALNGALVATFALPQVSWEPMEAFPPQLPPPAPPVPPFPIFSAPASDGGPLVLQAPDSQKLVPFAPEPVLTSNIDNVIAGKSFSARFSLPFGLIANIQEPNRPPFGRRKSLFLLEHGAFNLTRPRFPKEIRGAFQLTLKPTFAERSNALFHGRTNVEIPFGSAVLSDDVTTIFEGEFGNGTPPDPPSNPGVPVRRIDLSGYGASIFSEWSDENSQPPNIIKVQFDTVVGRAAYEVVKAATILYPYAPRLVRTITIDRQNTGWVQRTDSGWQPATQGIFDYPNAAAFAGRVHRGAVAGVFNIRNIRELDEHIFCPASKNPPPVFEFRKVLFDADIGLDHRVEVLSNGKSTNLVDANGDPVTLVAARDLVGYVQLAPDSQPATPDALVQLFARTGPIVAPFSCVAQVGAFGGKPGTMLRCAAIEVDMITKTDGGNPAPAAGAALRGAPNLPRDGHWGVGQRKPSDPAPSPLAADFPLPLVQPLSDAGTWSFANIGDVLQLGNPDNFYGILQDTATQKVLFEQPKVPLLGLPGSVPGIQLPNPPNFADVASLLNATGLFPDIANTISLATGDPEQLNTQQDGLQYTKVFNFDPNKPPLTLLDLGVIRVALAYGDEDRKKHGFPTPTQLTFKLDSMAVPPAHRWSFSVTPLTFMVTVPEFSPDPLLMVIGGFTADDQTKPTLSNLHLVYGDALASLTSVLDKLQGLAQFLPGGKGAGLQVGLSDGKLTVSDTFAVPSLPLGLGEITDVSLNIGMKLQLSPLSADFAINVGTPDNPFNWIVSPLAGNGLIDIGVKGGKPSLTVQGGLGLGLAIDVGIAEGSASITIAARLDITGNKITLMAVLTGTASVDVLGGLASASLTLSAAVGFSLAPFPPPIQFLPALPAIPTEVDFPSETITLLASVSVGIHISICWVVSVDFDGSWQFSQSVSTPALKLSV